jgi:hypothetical protein
VILGSGDIGMIMARRLTWEGCTVKAVVEIQPYVSGLLRNQVQCLEDYGIPLITSYTVTRIHGRDRIKGVSIAKISKDYDRIIGSEKFIECDTLLLSVGLIPENELTLQAGAELSKNGGPVVDENLETTIEGVFACGNVLQVHDLVDMVTAEAKRAGKSAVEYINKRFGKDFKRENQIKCIAGENVNYVKPDLINRNDIENEIVFTFRVKYPNRRVQIQFSDQKNKILFYKKNKIFTIPSEMIELKLNLAELGLASDCKNIIIDVIPRPEILLEEE